MTHAQEERVRYIILMRGKIRLLGFMGCRKEKREVQEEITLFGYRKLVK